jgi:hypothetical protein
VANLLAELRYSLRANRKTKEGAAHPDRDAQFEYINAQAQAFQHRGQPVVSVDTKKKELVGDFKNGGREWRPPGEPEVVRVHDFVDKELGKAIPYGVYDLGANAGGAASAATMTRRSLRWRAYGGGGSTWERKSIPRRRHC